MNLKKLGICLFCFFSMSSTFAQYNSIRYQNILCRLYDVTTSGDMQVGESTALSTSIMDYEKFRITSEANSASVNRVGANGQAEMKTFSWKVSYIQRYKDSANMLPRLGLKIGKTSSAGGGRVGSIKYDELVTTAMPVPFLVDPATQELVVDPSQRFELIFAVEKLKIVCGSF